MRPVYPATGLAAILLLIAAVLWPGLGQDRVPPDGQAILLDVRGAIGPATTEYLRQGFAAARQRTAPLVVIRMDTPGGLDTSMREIIREILASPTPVVTYVSPSGARAASAGTFILYASHLAAMAPGTNLGAATPVQIGGGRQPLGGRDDDRKDEAPDTSGDPADALTTKTVNDAAAFIRGLADLHGRNANWAEKAVREAASLSAREALDIGAIEIVASDVADLLEQANGRTVRLGQGHVTLQTSGLSAVAVEPDWRISLLGVITNPNVAYILLLIGIYGIIFEFLSPGAIVPGVLGAICLFVALFALNLLPISFAGVGLIVLGAALLAAEAFTPSFGVLGVGGIMAFALGSMFLFDTEVPEFQLSLPVILAAIGVGAALLLATGTVVVRSYRRQVATGEPSLLGSPGEVLQWSSREGYVRVQGERWHARGAQALAPGQRVRVIGRERLTLLVEPD